MSDFISGLSERNKRTLIIVAAVLLLALLAAGALGYQFQLLPGLLGQ